MLPDRFRRRLERQVEEIAQLRRDVEWWNRNRADAAPFDLGAYLVAERAGRRALDAWGTAEFGARMDEFVRLVERFADE
jgi:hypothetical protein